MGQPAWLVVARRELVERVRTKWFVIVTLLGPLLMVGLVVLPAWLNARAADKAVNVALVDGTAEKLGGPIAEILTARDAHLRIEAVPADTPQEALLARIRDKTIDGYLVLPADLLDGGQVVYYGANATNFQAMGNIQGAVQGAVTSVRAERAGLSKAQLGDVMRLVPFEAKHTTGTTTGTSGAASFVVAYIVMFILYMAIVLYAVNVMRSVVMEKSSRVIEVIISAIKPRALLMGKVFGVGTVGLIQQAIWLGMAFLLAKYRSQVLGIFGVHGGGGFELPAVGGVSIAVVLLYFFLGYFFYAALYGAIGAMVNSEQEAQQAQTPVILLLVIPVACVNLVANDPRGSAAAILTMIPFSSPVLMPMRWMLGGASLADVALSLGILSASLLVAVWLAARIYRVGILMYGKRPGLRELYRWLKY